MKDLLTRDEFRNAVFARDSYKCVICGSAAVDAHHILERRLFPDGGYYLDNGSSLCSECHIKAEQTVLSVEQIRDAVGIKKPVLPPHLYIDVIYDKWGNPFIRNKSYRAKGELFYDESVQKILNSVEQKAPFTDYVKYPRTYHLPWSACVGKDDRISTNIDFLSKDTVVTLKLDGENTTMYKDYVHARSIDGNSHWTQSWVRNLHSKICGDIPDGWRICGENLYARHSIKYDNLESYFYIFSIWNEFNECLSWKDTTEWSDLLEIPLVPIVYQGAWNEPFLKTHESFWKNYDEIKNEGYVVRNSEKFHYSKFKENCGKYVRKNHVTTSSHWKFEKIEKNELKYE